MRVIAKKTLVRFYIKNIQARIGLESWYGEIIEKEWSKPGDVITDYPSADVITGKRFVFNIKGNNYRLVADIEFKFRIIFIVWIGIHADYDKINVKEVKYVKNNQE